MSTNITVHQQIFDNLHNDLKQFMYIHELWQGVSCVRLKSGVMKQFVGAKNQSHMQTFLQAAQEICNKADEKQVWTCVRFSNNGYQSVLVYLGTRNVDEFLRLSKIRQQEAEARQEAQENYPDGILDENGDPYGDR
jgi:hypothetical protein